MFCSSPAHLMSSTHTDKNNVLSLHDWVQNFLHSRSKKFIPSCFSYKFVPMHKKIFHLCQYWPSYQCGLARTRFLSQRARSAPKENMSGRKRQRLLLEIAHELAFRVKQGVASFHEVLHQVHRERMLVRPKIRKICLVASQTPSRCTLQVEIWITGSRWLILATQFTFYCRHCSCMFVFHGLHLLHPCCEKLDPPTALPTPAQAHIWRHPL